MLKRFGITVTARILAGLLLLAAFAVLARQLPLHDFGVLGVAIFSMNLVQAVFDFGMSASLLRGLPTPEERRAFFAFGTARFVVSGLTLIILAVYFGVHGTDGPLIAAGALMSLGDTNGDVASAALIGKKKATAASKWLVARRVALVLCIGVMPTQGLFVAVASVFLLGHVALWKALTAFGERPGDFSKLVRGNANFMVNNAAANLATTDSILVNAVQGSVSAGLYTGVTRFLGPLNLVVSSFVQNLTPELSHSKTDVARLLIFRRARRWVLLASLLLLGVSPLAPIVIEFVMGQRFREAASVAIAICLAAALSALAQLHLAWFNATKLTRHVSFGQVFSVVVGLVLISVASSLSEGLDLVAASLVCMHLLVGVTLMIQWAYFTRSIRISK